MSDPPSLVKTLARSPSPSSDDQLAKRLKPNPTPTSSSTDLPPSTLKFCTTPLTGTLLEPHVGIQEYLSSQEGSFEGIVKQRFSDFMVYEVDTEGKVVRLKEIGLPVDPFNKPKGKKGSEGEGEGKNGVGKKAEGDVKEEEEKMEEKQDEGQTNTIEPSSTTDLILPTLPPSLQFPAHPLWTSSTTQTLLPLLPAPQIIALHELLLEGRSPKLTREQIKQAQLDARGADGGWGGMKRRDKVAEEEEAMNALSAPVAAAGVPSSAGADDETAERGTQGRARGRGREERGGRGGRGRGGRGGAGAGGFGHGWGNERPRDGREVLSDPLPDKQARTVFHQTIRSLFPNTFETFALETDNVSRIAIRYSKPGDKRGSQKSQSQSQSGTDSLPKIPKYIHFTLQKTNRDTSDCLSHISRILRTDPKSITTCGTKDKRGITVQRVCLQRRGMKLGTVWRAINGVTTGRRKEGEVLKERGERGVRVGDLSYSDEYLELGMLKGNHFTITLRNVKAENTGVIDNILHSMLHRGFINYYGMQRFGTASVSTHTVGLALLKSQWKEACEMLLARRPGEHPDVDQARQCWEETKDAEKTLELMPRRNTAERALLEFWARPNQEKTNYYGALLNIPRNLRLIYVHAYQSYIWNLITSERIRLNATSPIAGDLVYAEEKALEGQGEDAKPVDFRGNVKRSWQTSSSVDVKVLKEEDLQNYTIADVVIPMPGYEITYPEGKLFERYQEIMQTDGLDPLKMRRNQKEYSLEGSYRKIIHIPSELSWRHLRYDDPEIALSQSDEDILLGEPALDLNKPDGQFAALQLSLTLGTSSYATMALRELTKQDTSAAHQTLLTAAADDQKFKGSGEKEKVGDDDDEEEEAAAAQTVQDKDIKMDEQ